MNRFLEQTKALYLRLTSRQRVFVAAAVAAVAIALILFQSWQQERNYKPLFQNLSAEDAGPVLAALREQGVEVRLGDQGRTIRVPSEKVDEVRIQLASAGLPKSGRIGFEIFDKVNFGASEFAEQVNYHRAIEGELERTVMALQEVEASRVHITFPRKTLFIESQQKAKASVLVKLKPLAVLSKQNVRAISHLAASAVEGLTVDQVTVLDMRGNLLSAPRPDGQEEEEAPTALLEYRRRAEEDLLRKIQATLEPILGPAGFRASVSLDCDLASGDQSEETFDPSRSVMLSTQRSEDGASPTTAAGTPGTPSNLPRPQSRPTSGASAALYRKSESTTFQTSRVVRKIKFPQGQIKRLSVSILLDYMNRFDGAKRHSEPTPPEKIRAIKDLVTAAVGLQHERGDQIIVETIPFETTRNSGPAAAAPEVVPVKQKISLPQSIPAWLRVPLESQLNWLAAQSWAAPFAVFVALAVLYLIYRCLRKLGALIIGFVGRLSGRAMKGQHVDVTLDPAIEASTESRQLTGSGAEPAKTIGEQLAERAAEQERLTIEALRQLDIPKAEVRKAEVLSRHISDLAKNDSEAVANLIRSWVVELER